MLSFESEIPVPPKLNFAFSDLILIGDSEEIYLHFQAKSRANLKLYSIRVLDINSDFVKANYDVAATLFIKELLRLIFLYPQAILIETFEICDQKMGFACLSYNSLEFQIKNQKNNPQSSESIENIISDVINDVQFLQKDLKMRKTNSIISLGNIYQLEDSKNFFLGNWVKSVQNIALENENKKITDHMLDSSIFVEGSSIHLSEEIFALGVTILELGGTKQQTIKTISNLRMMPGVDPSVYKSAVEKEVSKIDHLSESLKKTLAEMLSLDIQKIPQIEKLRVIKNLRDAEEEKKNPENQKPRIRIIEDVVLGQITPKRNRTEAPKYLAWCSNTTNQIKIHDLQSNQLYSSFEGTQLANKNNFGWNHVREIPNTSLLISLAHSRDVSAKFEVFDIAEKKDISKIYSFDEVKGVTGQGDLSFDTKRRILGIIPIKGKASYHLFDVDSSIPKIKLLRKSKWFSHYIGECIEGLDIDAGGILSATIDTGGVCLISKTDTDEYLFHLQLNPKRNPDYVARCRWSSRENDPSLYVKYDRNQLNVLDVEKQLMILKTPQQLDTDSNSTVWIDVCPSDSNLLAAGGNDNNLKIYDRRLSKIVETFGDGLHSDWIFCVRWSPNGDLLATASKDGTAKMIDFKSKKTLFKGDTSNKSNRKIILFDSLNSSLIGSVTYNLCSNPLQNRQS